MMYRGFESYIQQLDLRMSTANRYVAIYAHGWRTMWEGRLLVKDHGKLNLSYLLMDLVDEWASVYLYTSSHLEWYRHYRWGACEHETRAEYAHLWSEIRRVRSVIGAGTFRGLLLSSSLTTPNNEAISPSTRGVANGYHGPHLEP